RKPVTAVQFTADGNLLASASIDGTVRLSEVETGKRIGKLKRLGGSVHGLAAARNANRYGSVYFNGVRVWDEAQSDLLSFDGYYYHGGEGQSDIALQGSGDMVWVTFRSKPHLRAWKLGEKEPQLIAELDLGTPAFHLLFSPNEEVLAIALYREIVLLRRE